MDSSARPTQTEGTARRRGRRPASEVSGRSILLETAQRHFSRCGFGGTSLRAIARDADVTPALVCQLFGSKEGLYDALLEKLALDQQTQLTELVRLADLAERHPKAAFERWVQMLVQIGPAISEFLHCSCMRSTPCLRSTTMGKAAFRALLKNWCGLSKEPPCPY